MSIFTRLSDLLKANINDLIDRAEDPEKMVKQIILDMQKELNKSTQALGKAVASEKMVEKQYNNAVATSANWEAKAKTALASGDQELAKKALSYKVKADEEAANYKVLIARSQMAETQKNLAKSMGGLTHPALWISSTGWRRRSPGRKRKPRLTGRFPAWIPAARMNLKSWNRIPRWTQKCSG